MKNKSNFIGTEQELNQQILKVLPLIINDFLYLNTLKDHVSKEVYEQVLEVVVECIERNYLKNVSYTRVLSGKVFLNSSQPIQLTEQGEKFLQQV